MKTLSVEAYDGLWVRTYWVASSACMVSAKDGEIHMSGNRDFLYSLAQQMLYFASNSHCMPVGTHVHYDDWLGCGYHGIPLVMEIIPEIPVDICMESSEEIAVSLDVPHAKEELYVGWGNQAMVRVSFNGDSVHMLANRYGFTSLAKMLLFLLDHTLATDTIICSNALLPNWIGTTVYFHIFADSG